MWMKTNHWRITIIIRKHSYRSWTKLPNTNNKIRSHDCSPKRPKQIYLWTWIFSPVSRLNHKWKLGQQHTNKYNIVKKCTTVWKTKFPCVHRHQYVNLYHTCKVPRTKSKWQKIPCKRFCYCHKNKNKKASLYHSGHNTTCYKTHKAK